MRWFLGLVVCSLVRESRGGRSGSAYAFYREMGPAPANESSRVFFQVAGSRRSGAAVHSRRIFGGATAALSEFPAVCALLDRYFTERCSGTVLSPHWALTAAHCAKNTVSYIKYNTRHSSSDEGDVVAVHYLYQHPEFRVLQEDVGIGLDVKLLHHDVGLVRTRDKIKLQGALAPDPLTYIRRYDPMSLVNEEVQVFGFGLTEGTAQGEELYSARLKLVSCGRKQWYHVMCGVGGVGGAEHGGSGVCSGDSGGPVVFAGAQVAVTSMGPRECERFASPGVDAFSVFTSLRPYVDILNATIADTDKALTMRMIINGCAPRDLSILNPLFAFPLRALLVHNPTG